MLERLSGAAAERVGDGVTRVPVDGAVDGYPVGPPRDGGRMRR